MFFLEQLVNGISIGAIYALFAAGFGIVFSTMRILNLAQGVYATYGAMTAYFVMSSLRWPYWLGCLAGIAAGAAGAVLVDQLAFEPLRRRSVSQLLGAVIASIGMWIALEDVLSIATNSTPIGFPTSLQPDGLLLSGRVPILKSQVIDVVCSIVGVSIVYLVVNHSKIGSAIRAVGFERRTAQIVGINPRTMIIMAAALSGAITGLAGILLATGATFDSTLGDGLLLQGFAAVVIGGMDDIRGSALAGLLIGIIQVMSAAYISSSFQDVITFGLVIIVLLWRPMGLFRTGNLQRA